MLVKLRCQAYWSNVKKAEKHPANLADVPEEAIIKLGEDPIRRGQAQGAIGAWGG